MSIEIQAGNDSSAFPVQVDPSPIKPPSRYPVAKPVAPRLKTAPQSLEPEKTDLVEDLLSPQSLRSFAWSIAAHSLFLLILAFWYFAPIVVSPTVLDGRLAGSPFGDESGDQLKGGLGMDTPLAMPEVPSASALAEVAPMITSLAVPEIESPATKKSNAGVTGASNGGGINLSNPGGAGNGDGFGVAKFGEGGENINGINVKVGDPQFTLIWNSRADIDLHVIEPGGSEIFWEDRNGEQGGELDVDDVDGFGPENINYVQGKGPRGTYRWFVHYYGGMGGMAQNTQWKVRVKYAGKIDTISGKFSRIGEKSRTYTLTLDGKDAPAGGNRSARTKAEMKPDSNRTPTDETVTLASPEFAPPGAGFAIHFSGKSPTTKRKDWDTPIGPAVGQSFSIEASEGAITITTIDFPAATLAKADKTQVLNDMATRLVSELKGSGVSSTNVTLNGAPGREVEFNVPDAIVGGGGRGRGRVFLAGSRLILISAVGTKAYVESDEAKDTFASLRLDSTK